MDITLRSPRHITVAGEFKTVNGRETFQNDCVHIWHCPVCNSWRQITEAKCPIDGTPRDTV